MAMALASLFRNEVSRIILCRPAVEAVKPRLLTGDFIEKVHPYRPHDALHDLAGTIGRNEWSPQVIEVAPCFCVYKPCGCLLTDEAQNTTVAQMKMFDTTAEVRRGGDRRPFSGGFASWGSEWLAGCLGYFETH